MSLASLSLAAAFAVAPLPAQSVDGVVWHALEVVSEAPGDFARVDEAAAKAGLTPGIRLSLNDPVLDRACETIRESFATRSVACHRILEGGGQALFVVQFEAAGPARADAQCRPAPALPADVVSAFERWQDILISTLQAGGGDPATLGEFVNDDDWLDYRDEGLHRAAEAIHAVLAPQVDAVIAGADSCEPEVRARAIALLNYSGVPLKALEIAGGNIAHPSEAVRNESLRLVSTFSAFMNAESRSIMMREYCELLGSSSFFDRNKSLAGINALIKTDASLAEVLDPACLQAIRTASMLSRSEQIGGYARAIVQSMGQ